MIAARQPETIKNLFAEGKRRPQQTCSARRLGNRPCSRARYAGYHSKLLNSPKAGHFGQICRPRPLQRTFAMDFGSTTPRADPAKTIQNQTRMEPAPRRDRADDVPQGPSSKHAALGIRHLRKNTDFGIGGCTSPTNTTRSTRRPDGVSKTQTHVRLKKGGWRVESHRGSRTNLHRAGSECRPRFAVSRTGHHKNKRASKTNLPNRSYEFTQPR